ncbi:MAG: hypothetical protein K2W82_16695 [Candidatus Obscuribacterales bacterium]|nr:hypothetical protein [Candidatus Obscuribacterales bacterium]
MTIIFGLVVLSGVVALVSAIIGIFAYECGDELVTNICGAIASFGVSVFGALPAVATGLLDWQAYVIPAAFAAGGIFFLCCLLGELKRRKAAS